jgi:hypothetical protein
MACCKKNHDVVELNMLNVKDLMHPHDPIFCPIQENQSRHLLLALKTFRKLFRLILKERKINHSDYLITRN